MSLVLGPTQMVPLIEAALLAAGYCVECAWHYRDDIGTMCLSDQTTCIAFCHVVPEPWVRIAIWGPTLEWTNTILQTFPVVPVTAPCLS